MRYVVDGFSIDPELFELTRDGIPMAIEPQAFNVPVHLLRHRNRVVSKEELMDSVCGGRFVTESAVTSRIKQIRRVLGDDGDAQRMIRTLHRRGYRFVGEATEQPRHRATPAPAAGDASPMNEAPIARRSNLPAAVSPLVGRTAELARLTSALAKHRLFTVLGIGGIGKTSLALEAARSRQDDDGPWLVELAGLGDGALLAESVATVLGIPSAVGTAALAEVIRDRRFLLVLDNCDHLLADTAAFVSTLLQRCAGLSILTTGRQILGVAGEFLLDLPPLAPADAARLFLERAELVSPGWVPDDTEHLALQQLCRGIDNLPLAIELAAAQSRALSVEQLNEQLRNRFTSPEGEPSDSRRHASMAAAITWSCATLSDSERELFDAICLFEGSFDLDGERAVSGTGASTEVLLTLINKSLVSVLAGSPRRYRILQTLREFVAPRRPETVTRDAQRRIVDWVCALAEQADIELSGPRSRQWMARLDQDKDTVRAALGWASHDETVRLRIAVGMLWFWYRRGHIADGLRALEPVARAADELLRAPDGRSTAGPVSGLPRAVLLRGAVGLVLLHYLSGDYQHVAAALDRVRALVTVTDDDDARSYALATVGYFDAATGHLDRALQNGLAALDISRRLGSDQHTALALLAVSLAHLRAGDVEEAQHYALEGVNAADSCGYGWAAVASSWLLNKARIVGGDFSESTVNGLVRVVNDSAAIGDITSWLVGLISLGYVLVQRGDPEQAAELVGISARQGQLIGFAPEAMDPVDTSRYLAEIKDELRRKNLMAHFDHGRALPTDVALARVAELFHPKGVVS